MKHLGTIALYSTLLSGVAFAAAPKNPSMNEYRSLLGRSAFIIKKPPVVEAQKPVNQSLKLRGVAKVKDGWLVTLYDRKKPQENIVLREGRPAGNNGLRLVSVKQSKGDYQGTTATVLSGGRQVTVNFDTEAIKRSYSKAASSSKKRAVNRAQPRNTNKRPNANRGSNPLADALNKQSAKKSSTGRRPRVRRTRPATQSK